MGKSIHTLIVDIQEYLKTNPDFLQDVGRELVEHPLHTDRVPRLRLSQMGERCPCALWHSIHKPEEAQALPPWANFKYSFGHMIEAAALVLAKAAGHSVVGEQDELIVDGIKGHRDAVVDGCCVDVKSTNSRSFAEFKTADEATADKWGYLSQLDGYLVGSAKDPLVLDKENAYLFLIDLQLGHMQLYAHRKRESHIRARIESHKQIVGRNVPPACTCGTIEEDNGNIRLDTKASYNTFKFACKPELRTFIFSSGPTYFTKVVKPPKYKGETLREIDRYGKVVYNG